MVKKEDRAKQTKRLALTKAVEETAHLRPKSTRSNETARAFAVEVARIMAENQCEDIVALDLRGVSPVCDYFVIGTGTSDRQMRAVADHIEAAGKTQGERPFGVGGYQEGAWIVVDYVDVVIHLFDPDHRGYYDLDSLWGDCPKVELK